MKLGKLFWKLFLANVLLMVVVLGICVFILARQFELQAREVLGREAEPPLDLLAIVLGVLALGTVLLALGLAWVWSGPVRRIAAAVRSIAHGDLSTRAEVSGRDELAVLAKALNRMRDRLAAQLDTIDRQRRTLESLLVQLEEGVVLADADGRIVLINPAAVRLLGLSSGPASPDPAAKRQEGEVPPGAESGSHADAAATSQRLAGRVVEECIVQHEFQQMLLPSRWKGEAEPVREVRVPGPEERDISLLASATNIVLPSPESPSKAEGGPDPAAPATGRLLVLTDITALTQMIQVKADFAANASHELRTPLSAIRGAIETLLQINLEQDGASAKPFLDMIDRHSARMEAMVEDLLNLSRIESAPTQFRPARVDLGEVLNEFSAEYERRVENKRLSWQVDFSAEVRTIRANPHLLRLVLDNLIDNAVKFTDPGGQVSIRARAGEDFSGRPAVLIEVADDGCGIAPEEHGRVFERFYQVERARSGVARGTGLGLSIVRKAVAAMEGSVHLSSQLEEGTTVTFAIPQESQPLEAEDAESAPPAEPVV